MNTITKIILTIIALGLMAFFLMWIIPTNTGILDSKIKQIEDFAQSKSAYGWMINIEAICCQDYGWLAKLSIYNPIYNEETQELDEGPVEEYTGWSQTPEEAIDSLILKITNRIKSGDK